MPLRSTVITRFIATMGTSDPSRTKASLRSSLIDAPRDYQSRSMRSPTFTCLPSRYAPSFVTPVVSDGASRHFFPSDCRLHLIRKVRRLQVRLSRLACSLMLWLATSDSKSFTAAVADPAVSYHLSAERRIGRAGLYTSWYRKRLVAHRIPTRAWRKRARVEKHD